MSELELTKQLLSGCRIASLGTLTPDQHPFVTLVTVAALRPTQLVMLLSGLAKHTKNIGQQAECSLLIQSAEHLEDPLAAARVTAIGIATKLSREDDSQQRAVFLKAHPQAQMYVDFADFAIYQVDVSEAHLVAGFGRIQTLTAEQLTSARN